MEFICDLGMEGRSEHGDGGGENQPWFVTIPDKANRFEQVPCAIKIDAVALVEICLSLPGDNRSQMHDQVGATGYKSGNFARRCHVARAADAGKRRSMGRRWHHDIMQRGHGDGAPANMPVPRHAFEKLSADHAGGTENEQMHVDHPSGREARHQ